MAQIHAELALGAVADAGLTLDDVDAYFTDSTVPGMGSLSMIEYLGLTCSYVDNTETGGSSYLAHVGHAAAAIAAGKCSVALCTLAGKPRNPNRGGGGRGGGEGPPESAFEGMWGLAGAPVQLRPQRPAPHVRVRHHQRTTCRDQGGGLDPCAVQPQRVPA